MKEDPENSQRSCPDRRDILRWAAILAGGGAFAGLPACSPAQEPVGESPARPAERETGKRFNANRFAILTALCGALIPQTDTPGAIEAGVPDLTNDLMQDWASDATRAAFSAQLDALEALSLKKHQMSFASLPAPLQEGVLRKFDRDAFSNGDRDWQRLKYIFMLGYYYSEPGATEELLYDAVPGVWEACIPFAEVGRTWATER